MLCGILTAAVWAAPIPPLGPVTVEGTIVEAEWSPSARIKGRPGMSGTLGIDRTEPAHFRVKLTDFKGVEPATAWRMVLYLGGGSAEPVDQTRPPKHLPLKLNHKNPKALKTGMRIRVVDYGVAGDEGGTWTEYKAIEVLSGEGDKGR